MQNIYIYNILYILSILTCFGASASSSRSLRLVLTKVKKLLIILKFQLNKSSALKCTVCT